MDYGKVFAEADRVLRENSEHVNHMMEAGARVLSNALENMGAFATHSVATLLHYLNAWALLSCSLAR